MNQMEPVARCARPERDESASLAERLDAAAACIAADPDMAAFLLEGLLPRMLACWLARRGIRWDGRPALLDMAAAYDEPLAYRVRLALRAPDVAARLAACQRLFAECIGAEAVAAAGM